METKVFIEERASINLEEVVGTLKAYFVGIDKACNEANAFAERLCGRALFADYIYHCKFLITEVRSYIKSRRMTYLPYVLELSRKNDTGHNCINCTGGCSMQHTARILEMASSMKKTGSVISYVQSELESIYNEEQLKGSLRWLSSKLEDIIDKLYNVLQYEEMKLLPGVKAVQKNINAHS
jgi:hypothetical protein